MFLTGTRVFYLQNIYYCYVQWTPDYWSVSGFFFGHVVYDSTTYLLSWALLSVFKHALLET